MQCARQCARQYSTRELSAAHTLLRMRTTVPEQHDPIDSSDDEPLDSSYSNSGKNNTLSDFAIVTCVFIFIIHTLGLLIGITEGNR